MQMAEVSKGASTSFRWAISWSESTITGVWYASAMLKASTVIAKVSATLVGASTGRTLSPCAEKTAAKRSDCSRHRLAARERRADGRPDPGDLILGLQQGSAVLPDVPLEDLHDLGGRGDGIAPEKLAAGEEGRRRADVVAVANRRTGARGDGRGQPPGLAERMIGGVARDMGGAGAGDRYPRHAFRAHLPL